MKETELTTIINDLKAGKNSILKTIFEDYGDYCIRNLRKKYNCSTEDAEDILMDAIINFREKIILDKITYLTSIRNYLYTTCCNMWLAGHSRQGSIRKKSKDTHLEYYEPMSITTEEVTEEAEHRKNLLAIIYGALDQMTPKCKKILTLFYLEEKSMKDIAELMGQANAAVAKDAKSRCYKKLMQYVSTTYKSKISKLSL